MFKTFQDTASIQKKLALTFYSLANVPDCANYLLSTTTAFDEFLIKRTSEDPIHNVVHPHYFV